MKNLLVGIPVFRIPDLLRRCLNALVSTPATILVVDNAADEDIKALLRDEFAGKIHVVHKLYNEYCNGGWNSALKWGLHLKFDIIALGSSDVILPPHWYETICERAEQFEDEVWVPTIGEPLENPDFRNVEHVTGGVAGFFSFLPRKAAELVYPIPPTLRHWFGDQYMFTKLRDNGWKVTLLNDVRCYHEQSAIASSNPETPMVIEQDKLAWAALEEAKRKNEHCS